MVEDPIVEEVRKHRDEYARGHAYDLNAIFRDLREKEGRSGHPVVSLPARRIEKSDKVA